MNNFDFCLNKYMESNNNSIERIKLVPYDITMDNCRENTFVDVNINNLRAKNAYILYDLFNNFPRFEKINFEKLNFEKLNTFQYNKFPYLHLNQCFCIQIPSVVIKAVSSYVEPNDKESYIRAINYLNNVIKKREEEIIKLTHFQISKNNKKLHTKIFEFNNIDFTDNIDFNVKRKLMVYKKIGLLVYEINEEYNSC